MLPCIEFFNNGLKFCAAGQGKGKPSIEHLAVFDTLAQLKPYLEKHNISLKEYTVLIPTHLASVRFLKLPSHNRAEIADMVKWQAAKQLPYSPEEIIYSYHAIGTQEGGFSDIILFLVRRDTVAKYLEALGPVGSHPSAVSLSCEGLKLLYDFQAAGDAASRQDNTALIEIAPDFTSVSLTQKGVLVFVRGVPMPGAAHSADKAVSEITLSLDAYRRQDFARQINRLLVSGPEKLVSAVIDGLKPNVSLPIGRIDHQAGLDLSSEAGALTAKEGYSFASCLGAALKGEAIEINLLPREIIGKLSYYRSRGRLMKSAALAAVVFILAGLIFARKFYDKNNFLAYLDRELGTLGEDTVKLDEKARRLELINKQLSKGSSALEAISALYKAVPSGITFSGVLYEPDKAVNIKGNCRDMSLALKFVSALEATGNFAGVQVGYVTKKKSSSGEEIDFEINAPLEK